MARTFDNNAANYLEVATVPATGTPVSMACWFNTATVNANDTMISLADSGTTNNWLIMNMRGGVAGDPIAVWINAAGSQQITVTTSGVTAGQWHHGLAVFASSTSRTIYLDGGSSATGTTNLTATGLDRLSVGRVGDSTPSSEFNGQIAEVALWDVALTAADALMLSKGYSPLFVKPGNLIAYYPIIGNNSPETDLIAGANLTVNGTV